MKSDRHILVSPWVQFFKLLIIIICGWLVCNCVCESYDRSLLGLLLTGTLNIERIISLLCTKVENEDDLLK